MKYCSRCKKEYDDSMNFCTICGGKLSEHHNGEQQPVVTVNPKGRTSVWKKLLLVVVLLIVGFFALVNYLNNAATYLRVEPNQLVATKDGGEIVVDIDYDGYIWTINHVPDWIEVEEYENRFEVKATENLTGRNREGSITIQSGKLLAQVVIQQNGMATYIRPSESSLHFDEDGGSEYVSIDTDGCNYTIESPDYISVIKDNAGIKIKAYDNSSEYRTGYIILKEDMVNTRIHVVQGGTCNNCHGSGSVTCMTCSGTGGYGFGLYYSQCFMCGGRASFQCGVCGGSGERE